MGEHQVDRALVKRAQQGDKRAFDLLVSKYQRRLSRLVSRFIKDEHEVADVVQEAFIKAYRALATFRGESAFYTWLYRIAINTAKNYLSQNGRRYSTTVENDGEILDLAESIPDYHTPEAELMNREIVHAINQAIEMLPEELRHAIILREMDGLSYDEIAQVMNCPTGTVRSRISRARDAIAKQLRPLLNTTKKQRW